MSHVNVPAAWHLIVAILYPQWLAENLTNLLLPEQYDTSLITVPSRVWNGELPTVWIFIFEANLANKTGKHIYSLVHNTLQWSSESKTALNLLVK